MTDAEFFRTAKPGSIIINRGSETSYIVVEHRGESLTAVRAANVTNPSEWRLYHI
ncbi:MAG: hypothetical protein KAS04_01185 [Candidatus Aenigmarchaeota archaeon]|nr:hypothetical protein [Candidatus Aenigmarchaeota archaeon]